MTKNEFLEGDILKTLLKFILPILIALTLQSLYGAADLWAVGHFGTASDVSGVTTGSQSMTIITAFFTGLSTAVTVLIGQSIGEAKTDKCSDIISSALFLIILSGVLIGIFMLLGAPLVARFMNTPSVALKETLDYLRICGGGAIFIGLYNLIAAIYRSIGDSRSPLLFVLYAAVSNIILDLIFTIVFKLGAKGVAIATVGAQAISVILSYYYMRRHSLPFPLKKEDFKVHNSVFKILQTGVPLSIQTVLGEFSFMIVISMTNRLGVIASAGVGVSEKIVLFLLLIPSSFQASMSAFTAQNHGAGEYDRERKGLYVGMAMATFLGLIIFLVVFFKGEQLAYIFTNDPEVASAANSFLKATSIECFIFAFVYTLSGYFSGIGKTSFIMIQSMIAAFLIRIPLAFYFGYQSDTTLFRIGLSAVIAAVGSLLMCTAYYFYLIHKNNKN